MAGKAEVDRRHFFKSALGFAGAMLAVNQVTGMRLFDVKDAEAQEFAALEEVQDTVRGKTGYVVDMLTHICTRKDGYIEGVNTTKQGMWFVRLLDGLGQAFGLENGTADMNVENYGVMVLEGSETDIGVFNPFGFREDYGGKDMLPIEEQAEVKKRWPDRTIMLGGGLPPNQGVTATLDELVDGYGYPHLTDDVKQKILGGNAARLWELKTAMNDQGRVVPRVDFG